MEASAIKTEITPRMQVLCDGGQCAGNRDLGAGVMASKAGKALVEVAMPSAMCYTRPKQFTSLAAVPNPA